MSDDDFFVGYLPTPASHARFLRRAAVVLLLIGGCAAGVIAMLQRDPGDAVWELGKVTELEGVVYAEPCPMIRVDGKSVLLVEEGKIGARERVARMDRKRVRVRGHILERAALRMFELKGEGIEVIGEAVDSREKTSSRRSVTLRGEIVDPKCYAGAMKPGDGKTHKGCAVLCLRGGIPPAFVSGGEVYLIVLGAGESVDALLPFVGDRVEARGEVESRGDLKLLHLSADGVGRI